MRTFEVILGSGGVDTNPPTYTAKKRSVEAELLARVITGAQQMTKEHPSWIALATHVYVVDDSGPLV